MSFIGKKGSVNYTPGWFLASEDCTLETRQMSASKGVEIDGGKVIPMGTIYPANDSTAEGIVYEHVDVSTGDMPGSVVTSGVVIKERAYEAISSEAQTALEAKGFKIIVEADIDRPYA